MLRCLSSLRGAVRHRAPERSSGADAPCWAPRSQGWSGAALLVLGLDTRRRMREGSAAGVLKSSGTVRFATAGVRAWPFLLILLVALTLITTSPT